MCGFEGIMTLKEVFDVKFLKFIFVGVLNTVIGLTLMFLFYHLGHFGYWGSSATSYVLASIFSFFMNKYFTFQKKSDLLKTAVLFACNIAVCYFIAYLIAKPLTIAILSGTSLAAGTVEQIAMVFGMCLFTILNYFGQRFVAFK
jgi:putative flippase GtrA